MCRCGCQMHTDFRSFPTSPAEAGEVLREKVTLQVDPGPQTQSLVRANQLEIWANTVSCRLHRLPGVSSSSCRQGAPRKVHAQPHTHTVTHTITHTRTLTHIGSKVPTIPQRQPCSSSGNHVCPVRRSTLNRPSEAELSVS